MAQRTTTAIDKAQNKIHPIVDQIQGTSARPIVRGIEWFGLSEVERLEKFQASNTALSTHPALRGPVDRVSAGSDVFNQDRGLSSQASEPLLRSRSDWSLEQTFQTLVEDFASRRDQRRADIASNAAPEVLSPAIPRSKSVSNVLNDVARRVSSATRASLAITEAKANNRVQQGSARARPRRRLDKADEKEASQGLAASRSRSIRWKSVLGSAGTPAEQSAMSESASRVRPALQDLSPNVVPERGGIRNRARQRVSSISQKLKKTVEIWRGDDQEET